MSGSLSEVMSNNKLPKSDVWAAVITALRVIRAPLIFAVLMVFLFWPFVGPILAIFIFEDKFEKERTIRQFADVIEKTKCYRPATPRNAEEFIKNPDNYPELKQCVHDVFHNPQKLNTERKDYFTREFEKEINNIQSLPAWVFEYEYNRKSAPRKAFANPFFHIFSPIDDKFEQIKGMPDFVYICPEELNRVSRWSINREIEKCAAIAHLSQTEIVNFCHLYDDGCQLEAKVYDDNVLAELNIKVLLTKEGHLESISDYDYFSKLRDKAVDQVKKTKPADEEYWNELLVKFSLTDIVND